MLLYEGGERLRFNESVICAGVHGVVSVLRALRMLPPSRKAVAFPEPVIARGSSWSRAPAAVCASMTCWVLLLIRLAITVSLCARPRTASSSVKTIFPWSTKVMRFFISRALKARPNRRRTRDLFTRRSIMCAHSHRRLTRLATESPLSRGQGPPNVCRRHNAGVNRNLPLPCAGCCKSPRVMCLGGPAKVSAEQR